MSILEWKTLTGKQPLDDEINAYIKKGWQPYGQTSVLRTKRVEISSFQTAYELTFYQTMVRRRPKE